MKQNFGRLMQTLAQRHGNKEALVNVECSRRYSFAEFHPHPGRCDTDDQRGLWIYRASCRRAGAPGALGKSAAPQPP